MEQLKKDVTLISKIPIVQSILDVICKTTGMGFAAVARVTEDRWIACSVRDEINFGLKAGGELEVATTICNEIRESQKLVVIDDVQEDDHYRCHHTPLKYGFRSYVSVPIIRRNGDFFGTLCAIDPAPAKVNNTATVSMFQLFAELIAFHLSTADKLSETETELLEEQKVSGLRDTFIAVLGHDLRNPLAAVSTSAQLLKRMDLSADAGRLVRIIQESSGRMKELIENLLDFAMGRLGGGISLSTMPVSDLERSFTTVINELRIKWNEPVIITYFNLAVPVRCDSKRLAQLLSNLLGNALSYGDRGQAITVEAVSNEEGLRLSIANAGERIPEGVMKGLFRPFARGKVKENQQGLGLGLYIAQEIAVAHHGLITATSDEEKTIFTFTMPAN